MPPMGNHQRRGQRLRWQIREDLDHLAAFDLRGECGVAGLYQPEPRQSGGVIGLDVVDLQRAG